jgi:hypothetical protein
MSRAVVLPTPGDPFIAGLWVSTFKKFWKSEVDQLYVLVNAATPPEVFQCAVDIYQDAGAIVLQHPNGYMGHGFALTELVQRVKEDLILFVEDDFYILSNGNVNRWFQQVEGNVVDCVASYRGCCTDSWRQRIVDRFGITGELAVQPNFWPSLCVTKKSDLERTDMFFDSKGFPPGTYIKELDWTTPETVCGDTFVWMSIQLRALNLRFEILNQNRLIDVIYSKQRKPPWVHIGSTPLMYEYIIDKEGVPWGNRNAAPKKLTPAPDAGILQDWVRRASFGYFVNERFPIKKDSPASFFNSEYRNSLNRWNEFCKFKPIDLIQAKSLFMTIFAEVL